MTDEEDLYIMEHFNEQIYLSLNDLSKLIQLPLVPLAAALFRLKFNMTIKLIEESKEWALLISMTELLQVYPSIVDPTAREYLEIFYRYYLEVLFIPYALTLLLCAKQ